MIVSLHVATGAAGGAAARTRLGAIALGPLLHLAGDWMPHQDIRSRRFEIATGIALVSLLAATRGPLSSPVLGALAASAPDVEHIVRLPRPSGRKLFPTHRFRAWHRRGGVPAWVQLLAAGTLVGGLVSVRGRL